ncbi:TPA: hypothetical protein ACN68Z_001670 [Klebsiella pneumoniae]|uniref:hypothetical protein n=1 Tax=Klebsiella pneumoniae TaxID=573 RepID=UPI00283F738B|nr:hypothetical protein [Klebsiella pneumoniae]MDR4721324.1 hypothetical protein [Klebsiella pneumoniae]
MTDITELALIKGQKVEAPYYLAECTECGKMYSSSKLIESRNYFDGDADCYCPHCNADDADIADLGSGEQPAVMAWNYQQARIDALVEALEKAQQQMTESENRVRKQNRHICELFDDNTALRQRIAELESRTVTVKLPKPHAHLIWIQAGHAPDDYWDDVAVSHSEKDRCCDGSERYPVYARWEIEEMLAAAGIKVEAE